MKPSPGSKLTRRCVILVKLRAARGKQLRQLHYKWRVFPRNLARGKWLPLKAMEVTCRIALSRQGSVIWFWPLSSAQGVPRLAGCLFPGTGTRHTLSKKIINRKYIMESCHFHMKAEARSLHHSCVPPGQRTNELCDLKHGLHALPA